MTDLGPSRAASGCRGSTARLPSVRVARHVAGRAAAVRHEPQGAVIPRALSLRHPQRHNPSHARTGRATPRLAIGRVRPARPIFLARGGRRGCRRRRLRCAAPLQRHRAAPGAARRTGGVRQRRTRRESGEDTAKAPLWDPARDAAARREHSALAAGRRARAGADADAPAHPQLVLYGDQIYNATGRCVRCGGFPRHHRIFVCNRPCGIMPCMLVSVYRMHGTGVLTRCSVCPRHHLPPPMMGDIVHPQ